MAELAAFTDYEKEFTQVVNSLPARINTLLNYESSADSAQTELRRIKGEMSQAKQLAMDMEIAARGIAEPTRREMGNKIRIHKETLATLSKDLQQAEAKFDRSALLGGSGRAAAAPLDFDKSSANRDRAQQQTEKLKGGTNVLTDAHRRLEETIEVGGGIMSELDRNRETLQRVRGNVRRGDGRARSAPWDQSWSVAALLTLTPTPQPPSPFSLTSSSSPGGRGLWHAGHCPQNSARHGQARDPEQDCSGSVCAGHGGHHWHCERARARVGAREGFTILTHCSPSLPSLPPGYLFHHAGKEILSSELCVLVCAAVWS